MSDVHLFWWNLPEESITATRSQVRRLGQSLGLPVGVHTVTASSFRRAAQFNADIYTDEDGCNHTLLGRITKSSKDFITVSIQREDGVKLAEWKYFAPRRTVEGTVSGSHDIRSTRSPDLNPIENAAVTAWLEQAQENYEMFAEGTSVNLLRRVMTETANRDAVPLHGPRGHWFWVYDDGLDTYEKLSRLLEESTGGAGRIYLIDVAASSDMSLLAQSADHQLHIQFDNLVQDFELRARNGASLTRVRALVAAVEQLRGRLQLHEQGLGIELPLARIAARRADRTVADLDHPGLAER